MIVFLFFCQVPVPDNIDSLFYTWFIQNDSAHEDTFNSLGISTAFFDSLSDLSHQSTIISGKTFQKVVDKGKQEYVIGYLTPQEIKKDSLYPLIIYLHGGIGVLQNDKGKSAYEMLRFLTDSLDLFLASPSGNKTTPWWEPLGLSRILQTLRFMTLRFPIDPDRIFLAGVSDGALGCYAAANAINAPFAGFISISGFGGLLSKLGIRLNPTNLQQRPIYNVNGGRDRLYPVQYIHEFLNWLKDQGVRVESKIYPDEDHGFDYRLEERAALLNILKTWRKPRRNNISCFLDPNQLNLSDNLLSWIIDSTDSIHRIITRWHGDTCVIAAKGIREFTMMTKKSDDSRKRILITINGNGVVKIKPDLVSSVLHLRMMQHFCLPRIEPMNVYSVNCL